LVFLFSKIRFTPDMKYSEHEVRKNWKEISSVAAPSVLGLAAGIFLGDMMHRGARRPVAFSLACLGMLAVTPTVVGAVKKKVAGPQTARGSRRTLDGIRNAGMHDDMGEDMEDGMYIG
jgi:hypothetical protein